MAVIRIELQRNVLNAGLHERFRHQPRPFAEFADRVVRARYDEDRQIFRDLVEVDLTLRIAQAAEKIIVTVHGKDELIERVCNIGVDNGLVPGQPVVLGPPGLKRGGKTTQQNPYNWCKTTVQKILTQQEYCGDVINFKTYSKSFKDKRRIENPEENWVIFRNKHEPIIDRTTFERVQTMISKTRRRVPKKETEEKSIFTGLMRCGDCGHNMHFHVNSKNPDIHFFACSNSKVDKRGTCTPKRHYVRADAIEQIVKMELQRLITFLKADKDAFIDLLTEKTNNDMFREKKVFETEIQRCISRREKLTERYEKLYEDNLAGKVTDEWFMELSHKYEVERLELKDKITELRNRVDQLSKLQIGREHFVSAIKKFMEMQTLTAPLLQELIDHIDVFEAEGFGKNKTQRIVIYYRFVGYLDLPDTIPQDNYREDTRQGVAIEYVTDKPQPDAADAAS